MKTKLLIPSLLLLAIFVAVFFPKTAKASEGVYELRPTVNEDYRCWAASMYIFANNRYKVILGCVDLIYPPKFPELYKYYVVWINPKTGKGPIRIGEISGGSGQYDVAQAFSEIFISLENQNTARTPSNNVVMRGSAQPINFLLRPTSPTPTPKEELKPTGEQQEQKTTETANLSTREKLVLALRRAGIAALVALVVIVGLIFVVSRSRG